MVDQTQGLHHQPVPPLVAKVLKDIADGSPVDTSTLYTMRRDFDRLHPFGLAQRHDVLVDGSGEELAIEFMTYFNLYAPRTY